MWKYFFLILQIRYFQNATTTYKTIHKVEFTRTCTKNLEQPISRNLTKFGNQENSDQI